MWTTGTFLATGLTALLLLGALPPESADDLVLAAVANVFGLGGMLGWARWARLERETLTAFGWPTE